MKTKPNPLDRVVTLTLKPHDASVIAGALFAVETLVDKNKIVEDTVARIILQLLRIGYHPDEATKAPYPI